jgi:hypothetical protein
MGQTPNLALPYPELTDPADVPADIRELADRLDLIAAPALVTSLPVSPVDGQEIYYQSPAMTTAGVLWHLRYRAAAIGAYKWEFVGGAALGQDIDANEGTASTVYVALPTAGPQVTVPLAGVYDIEIGARHANTTSDQIGYMSYAVGAVAANDTDSIKYVRLTSSGAVFVSSSRTRRKTVTAAGSLIAARYRADAGTAQFIERWMRVTPINVG